MLERETSSRLSDARQTAPQARGSKRSEPAKPAPKWSASNYGKPKRYHDTHPIGQEKVIENMEAVLVDLETRFHQVFGHKIKTLGLVEDMSSKERREIIKVCAANFSGFDKKTGRVKEKMLSPDRDASPEADPILSQVPEREWRLCEEILFDLNKAYTALDNLMKEGKMG
jgi:hypothetical protein